MCRTWKRRKRTSPTCRSASSWKFTAQNAVCASCHKTMDQLGFGLENFDAIGRWREQGRQVRDRCLGRIARRGEVQRPAGAGQGARQAARTSSPAAWPKKCSPSPSAANFACKTAARSIRLWKQVEKPGLPLLGPGGRDRQERSVPQATRRRSTSHERSRLSRRTVLQGRRLRDGPAALGSDAARAARWPPRPKPPVRMAFVSFPNGAIMDAWRPQGEGDGVRVRPDDAAAGRSEVATSPSSPAWPRTTAAPRATAPATTPAPARRCSPALIR